MKVKSHTKLPVTVDKSHITTLGERLYTESIELIRELVNNAYDADATEVKVTIQPEQIKVEDDGIGMDWEGLLQYFNIGSPEKLYHSKSTKYQRDRIGQFGIGKFASLAACETFEVFTQKEAFAARVIFDKNSWSENHDTWELPVEIVEADRSQHDGTTIKLSKLTRSFDPDLVRQKILESVPIQAKNFSVLVNGRRVVMAKVPGHRIPFLEGTSFGPLHGEIIIVPVSQASAEEMGIQIRVKGVMVRKEFFGIQGWGKDGARIRGEVNADFLVVTSDRSGFRTDVEEYKAFDTAMQKLLRDVKSQLGRLIDRKETQKVRRALTEAMLRIQTALEKHPEFLEAGILPKGEETDAVGEPGEIKPDSEKSSMEEEEQNRIAVEPEKEPEHISDAKEDYVKKPAKPRIKKLSSNAVIRKIAVADFLVTCCLDQFGEDGPECFTQGQVIYINRDHPLYKRETKKKVTHTMYLARLLCQEIALLKNPPDARSAFQKQSELLRDAFSD